MIYTCKYCGKEFHNPGGHKIHENTCNMNPNRSKHLKRRKIRKDNLSHDEWIININNKYPELFDHIEILGKYIYATQNKILVKCKDCGEIYEESLNNICRYGSWKCPNNCSHKIRKQLQYNNRAKNFLSEIKEKNPKFLEKYEIIGSWDGKIRSKVKCKCKDCGHVDEFMAATILSTNIYNCKGCTIIKGSGIPKLNLTKNELTKWLKINIPKTYEKLEILDNIIHITDNNKTIKVKCKKCGHIWNINIYTLCKKRNIILMCPNCNKRHDDTEEFLDNLIKSHDIKDQIYKCKYCGRILKNKSGLSYHENRCKHNPSKLKYDKLWKCPYCGKEFNNPNAYAGHIIMCINRPDWEEFKQKRYYGKV